MNLISRIKGLFENPVTRKAAIIAAIVDISTILAFTIAIASGHYVFAVIIVIVYAVVYAITRHYVLIYGAFPFGTDTDNDEVSDEL